MLGHSGSVGGKLASDWDISGCGGWQANPWNETWLGGGVRGANMKDKTEWGSEREKKRAKRRGRTTSPWATRMSRQTDSGGLRMQCKSMLQVNWGRKSFILLSSDRAYLEKQRDAKAEEEERELRGSVGFKQTGSCDVSSYHVWRDTCVYLLWGATLVERTCLHGFLTLPLSLTKNSSRTLCLLHFIFFSFRT